MEEHLCPPEGMTIVKMSAKHLDELAALEKECFSTPWSYDGLANELMNPLSVFYVAQISDEVAGYISMNAISYEGFINNLAVKSTFRRRGIGAALVQALCDYAHSHGTTVLTLEVRPSNAAAIRLYEGFGFRREGERKNFYSNPTENGLIMTKHFE